MLPCLCPVDCALSSILDIFSYFDLSPVYLPPHCGSCRLNLEEETQTTDNKNHTWFPYKHKTTCFHSLTNSDQPSFCPEEFSIPAGKFPGLGLQAVVRLLGGRNIRIIFPACSFFLCSCSSFQLLTNFAFCRVS